MTPSNQGTVLAFDVGDRRIGVASASLVARFAQPLTTILNDENVWQSIATIVKTENATTLVVGLPRSLQGNDTDQTRIVRDFADTLADKTGLQINLQDEALTSRQAEAELRSRNKNFEKGDIDALAATYILEDYLRNIPITVAENKS